MKTLFYRGNKTHTTQLFARILQNGFSKKNLEKSAELVFAYEKFFKKIMEAYHKGDVEHDSIIFPDRFLLEAINNY